MRTMEMSKLREKKKEEQAFPRMEETMSVSQLATTFSQVLQINTTIRGKEKFLVALKHIETGILDKGIETLEEVRALQYNPLEVNQLLKKIKKFKILRDEATELFFGGRYTDAHVKIMECSSAVKEVNELQTKGLEAKLFLQLSLIAYKLDDIPTALVEINRSLALNGLNVNGLLHRAYLHRRSRMYLEAIEDLKEAQKLDTTNDNYVEWIQEAEDAARRHHFL